MVRMPTLDELESGTDDVFVLMPLVDADEDDGYCPGHNYAEPCPECARQAIEAAELDLE